MKIKYLGLALTLLTYFQSAFSQIQLQLRNDSTSTFNYENDLTAPVNSNLLRRNGLQLTGTQTQLTSGEIFQNYFDENQLSYDTDLGDTGANLLFLSRNEISLEEGFNITSNGDDVFSAEIEQKLEDYDIDDENNGIQDSVEYYNPKINLRYFMSVFGPRLLKGTPHYRYDFHQGSDIIDLEVPSDTTLSEIKCMCEGTIVRIRKSNTPNDNEGEGMTYYYDCNHLESEGKLIRMDTIGTGQYLTIKCINETFDNTLGYTDDTIYTAYRHLDDLAKSYSLGDTIEKGEVIGTMGQTGITTTNHLHLSILRKDCNNSGNPNSSGLINVHPLRAFNMDYNTHLVRQLNFDSAFDNTISPREYLKFNPEIHLLNIEEDTLTGDSALIRIAVPFYQANIAEIQIRNTQNPASTGTWTFNFEERSNNPESVRDTNRWDMNGDEIDEEVYVFSFNRGSSANDLFENRRDDGHFSPEHTANNFPLSYDGVFRIPAYVLDIKAKNFTGTKEDIEVEVFDIWGNSILGRVIASSPIASNDESVARNSDDSKKIVANGAFNNDIEVKLFPNISTDGRVTADVETTKKGDYTISITVFSTLGEIVDQQKIKLTGASIIKRELDFSHLPKGTYFVQFNNASKTVSKKLVIQ